MPVGVSIGVGTWVFSGRPLVTREAGTRVPFLGAALTKPPTILYIMLALAVVHRSETEGVEVQSGDMLSYTAGWGKS